MRTDVDTKIITGRLIECFNQGSASLIVDLCDRSLSVNSAILGNDRRSNAKVQDPIAKLIAACRAMFPDAQFSIGSVKQTDDGFVVGLIGNLKSPEDSTRVLKVPCTCRVKLVARRIRELWFAVDEYAILQQLGRVCPDPGCSVGRSASINQQAMDSLRDSFTTRKPARAPVSIETIIHANIENYIDITTKGMEIDTFRLDGVGKINELLARFHSTFADPLELSFADGISQGHTTTFRGRIRAKVGANMQRYHVVCGFVSHEGNLAECWVTIAPPATLMECLT